MTDNLPETKPAYPDASVPEQLLGKDLAHAPQPALTAASGGNLTSGSSSPPMVDTDSVILTNALLRISQIEAALIKLGLLRHH